MSIHRFPKRSCMTKLGKIWIISTHLYHIDSQRIILRSCMTKLGFIWQNLDNFYTSLSHRFSKDHPKILHDKTGIYLAKSGFLHDLYHIDSQRIILGSCMTKLGFILQNLIIFIGSLFHRFLRDRPRSCMILLGFVQYLNDFYRISIYHINY